MSRWMITDEATPYLEEYFRRLPRKFNIAPKAVIDSLDGCDVATLTSEERTVLDLLETHGRKFGVDVSLVSEAPKTELENSATSQHYNEIVARYPSRITITTNQDNM
ncbi:hypothetical protein L1D14_07240 [Vibrio tubiashii]|uniref:hypothetical protein n=1 Tax=Vibrio tubiashii TaxID=29498 RepID=UPI001EFDE064|nr:hypothetical protein [Vibrio tubiashii]MCG9576031.1 hypothetical protein [Vibrio tubiashii]